MPLIIIMLINIGNRLIAANNLDRDLISFTRYPSSVVVSQSY